MTTVRATCNRCGDVTDPYWTFTCPTCGRPHIKEANRYNLGQLVNAGCRITSVIDPDFHTAAIWAELGVAS